MPNRINRAIELLEEDQPIYYTGLHTFSKDFLTFDQGKKDSKTWADYINIGMEHGSFDMTGLESYMEGLINGGPTNSGYITPPFPSPPITASTSFILATTLTSPTGDEK